MERFRNILVPTDFSPLSEAATARAVALARVDGSAIHLLHAIGLPLVVAPYGVPIPTAVWGQVRKAAQEKLEAVRSDVEARGVSVVTAEIPDAGDPVAAIRAAVDARGADLVVMGTHGHGGLHHVFLGSVAERTLRTVAPPVLVVKEEPGRAFQSIAKILLAVDFSAHSDRAVEVTAALGARLGASVDVVHAFELPRDYMPYASEFGMELDRRMQADVAEKLEAVQERLNASQVPSTLHSRRGRPSAVIVQAAAEFHSQLIAMGNRGQTGLEHVVLGSVAERTLRTAPCSVLVLKAERAEGES